MFYVTCSKTEGFGRQKTDFSDKGLLSFPLEEKNAGKYCFILLIPLQ